jgi:hypothetical protein
MRSVGSGCFQVARALTRLVVAQDLSIRLPLIGKTATLSDCLANTGASAYEVALFVTAR